MTSPAIASYTDPAAIAARLEVLYDKANRIVLYDRTVVAGAPDPGILDEKQRQILAEKGPDRDGRFPRRVFHTLLDTLDRMKARRREIVGAAS